MKSVKNKVGYRVIGQVWILITHRISVKVRGQVKYQIWDKVGRQVGRHLLGQIRRI